jgi:hypothetical protein
VKNWRENESVHFTRFFVHFLIVHIYVFVNTIFVLSRESSLSHTHTLSFCVMCGGYKNEKRESIASKRAIRIRSFVSRLSSRSIFFFYFVSLLSYVLYHIYVEDLSHI